MTFTRVQIKNACDIAPHQGDDTAMWYLFMVWERKMMRQEEACLCDTAGWRHCAKHEAQRADPVHQEDL